MVECRWLQPQDLLSMRLPGARSLPRGLGFRRHRRPIAAAVRREIESTRRLGVPRLTKAGEGRAADAERRGNTAKMLRFGHTGVAFSASAQARGCVVTGVLTGALVIVGVIVIVAGSVGLFMGLERASLRRLERRREAWRAGGCVGPEPQRSTLKVQEDTWKTYPWGKTTESASAKTCDYCGKSYPTPSPAGPPPPFPKKVKRLKDWYARRRIWQEADAQNKGWCSSVCKKKYLNRIYSRRRQAMGDGM